MIRGLQLALYGFGAIAALVMTIVSVPDARLPWFLVMLFSGGCFFDTFREEKTVR